MCVCVCVSSTHTRVCVCVRKSTPCASNDNGTLCDPRATSERSLWALKRDTPRTMSESWTSLRYWDFLDFPYFLSAQLDGVRGSGSQDTARQEGWIGLVLFNVAAWITIVVLDIHLLAYEFNAVNTTVHMLQTAALVTVAIPAVTLLIFTALHYSAKKDRRPFSSDQSLNKDARTLPPFATALISGGLRATLSFTLVILILNCQTLGSESVALKIVVAQVCLKTFGSAMALANQRLQMFSNTQVM